MKKTILTLLMVLLMLSILSVPAFASCDICIDAAAVEPSNHCAYHCTRDETEICSCGDRYTVSYCSAVHLYTVTPLSDGMHKGTCACGDSYTIACTFNSTISTVASTCVTQGYTLKKCAFCSNTQKETLPLSDHSYLDTPTTTVSATCTTGGYKSWKCVNFNCTHTEITDQTDPLGHNFEMVSSTAATCSKEGSIYYECQNGNCTVNKTETLARLAHSYPAEPDHIYVATCTSAGYKAFFCLKCDHSDNRDWTAPLGHSWTESSQTAGCAMDGYYRKECSRCGLYEQTIYPATGHAWSDEPTSCDSTCTYAGTAIYVCTTCGEEETRKAKKLAHQFTDGICTMCGVSESDVEKLPSGGSSSGGSSSAGGSSRDSVDVKRVLSLLSVAAVSIGGVALYIKSGKKKSKHRR